MQGETSGLKDIVCMSRDALLLLWIEASAKCMCFLLRCMRSRAGM